MTTTTTKQVNEALYVASTTGTLAAPGSLSFKYSGNGLTVTKTFSFDETYLIHADVAVTRNGAPVRALISWPGGFGDQDNAISYNSAQVDSMRDDQGRASRGQEGLERQYAGRPVRVGGRERSVLCRGVPAGLAGSATLVTLSHPLDVAKTIMRSGGSDRMFSAVEGAGDGAHCRRGDRRHERAYRACASSSDRRQVNVLKAIHPTGSKATLEPLLDFGFFGPIGKYLFLALQFIHAHVVANWPGSWGWAIVLLTVAINLLILPLRIKTMQSGLKMQRIQPQMDAIKEKYKKYKVTDPKRNDMNAEIMKLQKDNGVNMFGGCIPTLIQMPLLFAFFGMLPKVVELRQAHWFWLPDLHLGRPVPYSADRDGAVAVPGAVLHAFAGCRSAAAEDDGVHDAGVLGVHDLELCLGPGAVLVGRQPDRHRAAVGDEPDQPGPGDAGDCGEAGATEVGQRNHDPGSTVGRR